MPRGQRATTTTTRGVSNRRGVYVHTCIVFIYKDEKMDGCSFGYRDT